MEAGSCSRSSWPPPPRHDGVSSSSSPGGSSQPCSDGDSVGNNTSREADAQDLISQLPDAIICEIFSYLTMEEIVKTSILSRRWRYLWTGTRTITFSLSAQERRSKLGSFRTPWIDRVLAQCTALAILKFQVSFGYAPSKKGSVDGYISFAVARGVKDMELNLSSKVAFREPRDRYVLPGILLSCRSVVRLSLGYCSLKAVKDCGINWRSLRALCIGDARLDGQLLDEILEGSPFLERRRITVLSTWLRELVVDDPKFGMDYFYTHHRVSDCTTLEIYAPYLLSLRILGNRPELTSVKLNEVSSLMDVELNLRELYTGIRETMLKELFRQLRGVHKLRIGSAILEMLCKMEAKEDCPFEVACQQLTLQMRSHAETCHLSGIAAMLRCAPVTEKLVIILAHDLSIIGKYEREELLPHFGSIYGRDPFARPNGRMAGCTRNHLRSIEIFGRDTRVTTTDWKTWLPLIEFMLREELVLEEMIIHIDACGFNTFSEEILRYNRGSITAHVVFKLPC